MDNKRWAKRIMTANFEGKRPRGRPRTTWFDNIKTNLGKNTTLDDAVNIAQDRDLWRALCHYISAPTDRCNKLQQNSKNHL